MGHQWLVKGCISGSMKLSHKFPYYSSVHGRLPYEVLRPDHVLRTAAEPAVSKTRKLQIFSNGDKVHVAKTLSKLGLKDCFEGVICFETLNPISDNEDSKSTSCRKVSFGFYELAAGSTENCGRVLPRTAVQDLHFTCLSSEYFASHVLEWPFV